MRRALAVLLLCPPLGMAWAQPQAVDPATLVADREAAQATPLLTRDALLGKAAVEQVLLSPDGSMLAYAEREGRLLRVKLQGSAGGEARDLFGLVDLRRLHWTADSRYLLLELEHAIGYLAPDGDARPAYLTLLDREAGDYFLGPAAMDPEHLLVVRRRQDLFVLERWTLAGERRELHAGPERIDALTLPGEDAVFLQLTDATSQSLYLQENGRRERIVSCGLLDLCSMKAYDAASRTLWLEADREQDLVGLHAWSRDSRTLRLVHSDPWRRSSLYATVFLQGTPLLAQYHDLRTRNYALDPGVEQALQSLEARFPTSNLRLQPSSGGRWLLTEEHATLRDARHFFFDPGSGDLQPVLEFEAGAPAPDQLSTKHFIQYPASDGLLLNGYVSLPRGRALDETPLVAWVHGGPQARALADYSPEVQLLVNRGYAVFEPNFRASTGFGRAYMTAAEKDFGEGRVQQDILDGLDYLLARGIGDPDRQAIAGGSFGGFSVLAGLAFTPGRFRAGVAFVPPAELGEMARYMAEQPGFGRAEPLQPELLRRLLVDLNDIGEVQRLRRKSPLLNVDAIRAPLLVMAGGRDDRVDINQVKDFSLRLQRQGKPLHFLLDPEEGHAFRSPRAHRVALYVLEAFLGAELGGPVEPLTEEDRRYLDEITRIATRPDLLLMERAR